MPPHTTTLPPPPKVLTQSVLQSTYHSLHLLRTFTLWSNCCSKNMDSSLNVTFLHMFKFQCTWALKGLMVNHSLLGRLVGSPVRLEIGCMHSAWVESCRPYHPANRDFKSVEACLEFLRKRFSCGVIFLGCPLRGLPVKTPVIWKPELNLEEVLGLVFCRTPAWSCPITLA